MISLEDYIQEINERSYYGTKPTIWQRIKGWIKKLFTDDPDDYYDSYENYSWEDSLMDALDGEMDAYWNID